MTIYVSEHLKALRQTVRLIFLSINRNRCDVLLSGARATLARSGCGLGASHGDLDESASGPHGERTAVARSHAPPITELGEEDLRSNPPSFFKVRSFETLSEMILNSHDF